MNIQASYEQVGTRAVVALDATNAFDLVELGISLGMPGGIQFWPLIYKMG